MERELEKRRLIAKFPQSPYAVALFEQRVKKFNAIRHTLTTDERRRRFEELVELAFVDAGMEYEKRG